MKELSKDIAKRLAAKGAITAQAIRSASPWSIGLAEKENSIHECYLTLIKEAEHFIYIENQFFISNYTDTSSKEEAGKDDMVRNRISKAIYRRIHQAVESNTPFKVIIFIPLMSAAEGKLDQGDQGSLIKVLLGQQNLTLSLAVESLIQSIKRLNVDYEDYLMICSLRKYEFRQTEPPEKGFPSTELIYIHSKVGTVHKIMIVDDSKMIIGSANINDRSMWGSRDSELAVCLSGDHDTLLNVNGQKHFVNSQIHEFRTSIFKDHFGLSSQEVLWPGSELFWKTAYNVAKLNTQFYERVFKVFPSNLYPDFHSLRNRKAELDLRAFEDLRGLVSGYAVEYPIDFLCKEHLENAKYEEMALALAPYRVFL